MDKPKRLVTHTVKVTHGNPAYLRAVREAANVTQGDVAAAAGVSTSYVSELERGTRPLKPTMLDQFEEAIARLRAARENT